MGTLGTFEIAKNNEKTTNDDDDEDELTQNACEMTSLTRFYRNF